MDDFILKIISQYFCLVAYFLKFGEMHIETLIDLCDLSDAAPLLFSMLFHQLCMFNLICTSMLSFIFLTKDAFSLKF